MFFRMPDVFGLSGFLLSLDPILGLCRVHGLPLHVLRGIGTSVLEAVDVINHVAFTRTSSFTCRWARVSVAEFGLGVRAPFDFSVAIPSASVAIAF